MTDSDNAFDLQDPAAFPYWTDELIRFSDLDRLNHVNNVSFAVYAESGRVDFLEHVRPGSTAGTGIGWVIVRLTVNYLAAAYYPGRVRIGSRVTRLGRSSAGLGQGIFTDDKCFGTADSVLVWADTRNEQSLPLPDDLHRSLAGYMGAVPPIDGA